MSVGQDKNLSYQGSEIINSLAEIQAFNCLVLLYFTIKICFVNYKK